MRAHYLQHVPFEGLGSIEPWLTRAGYTISRTPFFESAALPELGDIDLLIAMGGPMSVNDEEAYPWLAAEKRFVAAAIEAGKPVLGVCLGAQLIAAALGAAVYANSQKEIGWFPIKGVGGGGAGGFPFPRSIVGFHWHGETFDLPEGAVHLARSEACVNQAFQFGSNVVGLQFHLETTPEGARAIATNCRDELTPGRYVQSEAEIVGASVETYRCINALLDDLLAFLAAG